MSKVVIVTYKIKDGRTEENVKFVETVFTALTANSPTGVKYASTIAADKLTFTHIAYFENDEAQQALLESAEFKSFQADLKDRCDIPPQPSFNDIVGSYNLF